MDDKLLIIVGYCQQCGAPIYGKSVILKDEQPVIKYSCSCWRKEHAISQVMETK